MNEKSETYELKMLLLVFSVYCNTVVTVIHECYLDFSNIQCDGTLSPLAESVTACNLFISGILLYWVVDNRLKVTSHFWSRLKYIIKNKQHISLEVNLQKTKGRIQRRYLIFTYLLLYLSKR